MGRISADLWGRIQIGAMEERSNEASEEPWGKRLGGKAGPAHGGPLPQPWALCQEDAANLVSRDRAILNEQRDLQSRWTTQSLEGLKLCFKRPV